MKAKTYIMAVAGLLMCLSAVSCGGKNTDGEAGEDAKLQYAHQVNEVQIMELKYSDFNVQLLSNGKLSAARKSSLRFRQGGVLSEVNVVNGTRIASGAVIAKQDQREARANLASAKISLDKSILDLQDVLAGLGYSSTDTSVPEDVMKMAEIRSGHGAAKNNYDAAKYALESTILRAPFAGKLADLKLKPYDYASGDVFCTLLDDSSFDVNFTILESEYAFIEKGQDVKVSLFGDDGNYIRGRITAINPVISSNGLIDVTAVIPGDKRMLDGMNVKVVVEKTIGNQLVVPKSAVVIRDNMEVLFRYHDNGTAEWVYVNTVKANSESYSIVGNKDRDCQINEGDRIIISGNFNLADGSEVTVKQ